MEAFQQLTAERPWIPFIMDLSTSDTVEVEEHQLFNDMESQFKRHVAPSTRRGYNEFAKAWNQEASISNHFKARKISLYSPKLRTF